MADPLATWHAEHVNFARLLDILEEQIAVFHRGESPNYALMSDILYYMRNFSDRVHHPREDVAYARLAERDPDARSVVNRLLQEHRVLATAGEELLTRINEAAEDVVIQRAVLEAATATYLVYYRHHMSTEERDVMPRAAQVLSDQDWAAVDATVPASPDPLFGDKVLERFEMLRTQIGLDAQVSRDRGAPPHTHTP
ncbi:hemerythrin domain-containing protein [Paraburkholderia sp. LEh10]|jgi:hemerythrin-like domain-containing protein|uniref:hemerythrin domain-containing protein n=1 Tax=Paraburkholderia sp. LEh10 TaxID=2821353 RepID=UPI001AE2BD76|nr:hemerythrin domain-containing protein [Paraburkholderia sp. LEh10]MBP0593450.1 hemerythrin domain-containing protein [Paraburkholderia sp. LEh10]